MNVPTIPIKFSVEQILSLTRQLPKELKLQLIKEWVSELERPYKTQQIHNIKHNKFIT